MGKYALTEQERKWLEKRKKKNTRLCTTCQNHAPWYVRGKLVKLGCRTDSGEACPFYRSSHTLDDYRDAAEFEARVQRALMYQYEKAYHCKDVSGGFMPDRDTMLMYARLAVEQEMDQ